MAVTVFGIIESYLLTGLTSKAAYDVIQSVVRRVFGKSLLDLYLDAMEESVRANKHALQRLTRDGGQVQLMRKELRKALTQHLDIDFDLSSMSELEHHDAVRAVAGVFWEHDLLAIGGHQLPRSSYEGLVTKLVLAADRRFRRKIFHKQPAFNSILLGEVQQNRELLKEIRDHLGEQARMIAHSERDTDMNRALGELLAAEPLKPVVTVPAEFFGRKDQIGEFRLMLRRATSQRVLILHGAPGIGKSWLLNRLTQECETMGYDWAKIDFRSFAYDPLVLMADIRNQLGPRHFAEFSEQLAEYVYYRAEQLGRYPGMNEADRRILFQQKENLVASAFVQSLSGLAEKHSIVLLLDSFERIQDTDLESWVRDNLFAALLQECGSSIAMVVAGWSELAWGRDWRGKSITQVVDYFSRQEVSEYLSRILGTYVGETETLHEMIYEYTQGHPLCVGLAVSLLETWLPKQAMTSPTEALAVLSEHSGKLTTSMVSKLLVERLLDRLDPELAQIMMLCAVPRWFDAGIVAHLAGTKKVHARLTTITGYRSFTIPRAPGGFEYHEIVRRLLVEKWRTEDLTEYTKLNRRALEYFRSASKSLSGRQSDAAIFEQLYHQFVIDELDGVRLFRELFENTDKYFRMSFREALCQELAGFSLGEVGQSLLTYYKARLAWDQGEREAAISQHRALLARSDLHPILASYVADSLGMAFYVVGEFDEALRMLNLAADVQRTLGSELHLAVVLTELGELQRWRGQWDQAIRYHVEALKMLEPTDKRKELAWVLVNLGNMYRLKGEWNQAVEYAQRSVDTFHSLGFTYGVAVAESNLGRTLLHRGNIDDAERLTERSLSILENLRDELAIATSRRNLADIYLNQGRLDAAMDSYRTSLEAFRKLKATHLIGPTLGNLGMSYFRLGDSETALEHIRYAIDVERGVRDDHAIAWSLINMGNVLTSDGSYDSAYRCFDDALQTMRSYGNRHKEAAALVGIATVRLAERQDQIAMPILEEAEAIAESMEYWDHVAILRAIRGESLLARCKWELGSSLLYQACVHALRFNRYHLDHVLDSIESTAKQLADRGMIEEAAGVCRFITASWSSEGMYEIEVRARPRQTGDATEQTTLAERLSRLTRAFSDCQSSTAQSIIH